MANTVSEDIYLFSTALLEVFAGSFEGRSHCFLLEVGSNTPSGRRRIFLSAENSHSLKQWERALLKEGVTEGAQTAVQRFLDFFWPGFGAASDASDASGTPTASFRAY